MGRAIKIEVFGRLVLAIQSERGWTVFYLSGDGKRRRADDIVVPSSVTDSELENYLDDLCHEWATAEFPVVKRID